MLTPATRNRDEQGFSLVELLVVIVLVGVVGTIVMTGILSGFQSTARGMSRIEALNDLQKGIERIGRELRVADPLVFTSSTDFANELRAVVFRDNKRFEYRYYLASDDTTLQEDVTTYDLSTDATISSRTGLFITDIANHDVGQPIFTYYHQDGVTGELVQVACAEATETCRDEHLTASQVRLTLMKKLDRDRDPVQLETVINIRNTRYR